MRTAFASFRPENSRYLVLLVALTAAACGDDTGSGGAGASPSTGGAGGDGGSGATMLVGGSTGTGTMPTINVGEPCTQDAECADGLCFVEDSTGWPKGYCTAGCGDDFDCYGGTCLVDLQNPFCTFPCATADDCRPGYTCETVGSASSDVCLPGCTDNDQCTSPQECIVDEADPNIGLCVEDEQCHDEEDNDLDDRIDCGDADCLEDTECAADIAAACGDAGTLMASQSGNTTSGTSLFTGDCGFVTGIGREEVYTIATPTRGQLTITAVPSAGDVALYARSSCADPTTQAACADSLESADATEIVNIGAIGGETWSVFVDAYAPGQEGGYSLTHTFTPAICGDNIVTLPETCDDMNATPGDGCSDLCEIELDFYCGAAEVITLGTTQGTTATGTSIFSAPQDDDECVDGAGIDGNEKLYVYTPAADGMLTIDVGEVAFDVGIYVRTDCTDGETQIACSDTVFQNVQDESLTIPVTNGVPVTIFVDAFLVAGGPFEITLTQP